MTSPTTNAPARPALDLLSSILAVFRGFGRFVYSLTLAARISSEIDQLLAMSDADLARKGLRREDVVRHVFGMTLSN